MRAKMSIRVGLGLAMMLTLSACSTNRVPKTVSEFPWWHHRRPNVEMASVVLDEQGYPPDPAVDGPCRKRFVTREVRAHSPAAKAPTRFLGWGFDNLCDSLPTPTPPPSGQTAKETPTYIKAPPGTEACRTATIRLSQWQYFPRSAPADARPSEARVTDLLNTQACQAAGSGLVVEPDGKAISIAVPLQGSNAFVCPLAPKVQLGQYRYVVEFWVCTGWIENRDPIVDIPD